MNLTDAWTDAVRQIVTEAINSSPRGVAGFQATVTAVTAGVSTITWNGSAPFPAAHLASYTPTVGHQVLVLLVGTDPVVVGNIVGTP